MWYEVFRLNLPNMMMRTTPAKLAVTDQNRTGLNQSGQSPQSLIKTKYYNKIIFMYL